MKVGQNQRNSSGNTDLIGESVQRPGESVDAGGKREVGIGQSASHQMARVRAHIASFVITSHVIKDENSLYPFINRLKAKCQLYHNDMQHQFTVKPRYCSINRKMAMQGVTLYGFNRMSFHHNHYKT